MLQTEGVKPGELGYDRPSSKLIQFCQKHYGLYKPIPLNNNYVIFEDYWSSSNAGKFPDGGFGDTGSGAPRAPPSNTTGPYAPKYTPYADQQMDY